VCGGQCRTADANHQARFEALRPQRRAAEKERRRKNALRLAQGYAEGTLTDAEKEVFEKRKARQRDIRHARKTGGEVVEGEEWRGGVVIDLGFDEMMHDQVCGCVLCACVLHVCVCAVLCTLPK